MNFDLSGMNAIVTGAGRGIGKAIAEAFAAAGASVALLARSEGEITEAANRINATGSGRGVAIRCDVSSAEDVKNAVAWAEDALGRVGVVVNNAAILGPLGPFSENDPDLWWKTMEVDVRGPMLCTQAVLPSMLAERRGAIINVVSGAVPVAYLSAYMTAKSALIRFSECLALELKPQNIAVFPMGPGTVRTAMSDLSLNSPEGRKWIPWFRDIFDEGVDLPVERPAALAVALASGQYDALSGLNVCPFDDLDLMLARRDEIAHDKLYSMRIKSFETPHTAKLAAIRERGAKAR